MDLKFLRDRRVVIGAAGAALAILAGVGLSRLAPARLQPPIAPSDQALQVEMSTAEPAQDSSRAVRCFAGGQYVGMLALRDCAERNGVAPGAMDVGLDTTGMATALVADGSDAAASDLAALDAGGGGGGGAPPAAAPQVSTGPCWVNAGGWRKVAEGLGLDACVQALFNGRCVGPGQALYGRWGGQTLRLVPGRVERSGDNRNFQLLISQPPGTCAVPHLPE
jgi:hypothetical protein